MLHSKTSSSTLAAHSSAFSAPSVEALFAPGGFADACPIAMVALTLDGDTICWNRAADELLGWTSEELAHVDAIRQITAPPEGYTECAADPHARLPAESLTVESHLRDGRSLICKWERSILTDETGTPIAMLAAVHDITGHARAGRERDRLQAIAAAAIGSRDVHEILRMVRQGVLEVGGFDRVGIWLYRDEAIEGSWGTDLELNVRDERSLRAPRENWSAELCALMDGENPFMVTGSPLLLMRSLEPTAKLELPAYCAIPLRAWGSLVGVVFADNRPSQRPISESDVQALVPFCGQIALTVANLRSLEDRQRMLERQRRIMDVSAAINASREKCGILRLLRDALVEPGGFDRAGIWLLEGDMVRGSWGTSEQLEPRDESHLYIPLAEMSREPLEVMQGKLAYIIQDDPDRNSDSAEPTERPRRKDYATIAMRSQGRLIGIAFVDNMVSRRPIRAEDIEAFQPLCEQAAIAVINAGLLSDRDEASARQRRLLKVSAEINESRELYALLRLVRDAMVEVGGFDRAGIFLLEGNSIRGSWGTYPDGKPRDERCLQYPLDALSEKAQLLIRGVGTYYIEVTGVEPLPNGTVGVETERVVIALRAAGEMVGAISADNLITGRPILADHVEQLLPFVEHVAIAIRNERLITERERLLERQGRLASLAAAISARKSLSEILLLVHSAVREAAGFDRVGVFLIDRERQCAVGTWGTDRMGQTVDISHLTFDLEVRTDRPLRRVLSGELGYWLTQDLTSELRIEPDHDQYGVHCQAIVPLRAGDEVLGAMAVDNLLRDAPITRDDIELLLPFAEQAAVAIQNTQLFEDLRRAQDTLVRSEKLRALGELAGGVAHNINNLLTAVLGYSELIKEDTDSTERIRNFARIIERAADDGAEIVRRVQQFARKDSRDAMLQIDLAEVAQEAIDLTRPAWHTRPHARGIVIEVIADLVPNVTVMGVASEIREVIVNLITNAADAMPAGGALTVRVESLGQESLVAVSDTGIGMDDETCKRVFEPFFTTKGHALGTGLGLSLAWGITTRHQGRIEVESAPGIGSTFALLLPSIQTEQPSTAARALPPDGRLDGVRVLVVDDEEFVGESVARMLTVRGAEAVAVRDANAALRWVSENAATCDFVLTDHGMTGMTGLQLLERLERDFPHIGRVLLSGWGANPPGDVDLRVAHVALGKPVRQTDIVKALAAQLAART